MIRSGLVLAGGASTRFRGKKSLALFEGKPMIRRVCEALAPRCDEVLVSVALQEDARKFEAAAPRVRVIRDVRPERGPIEGLRRGFAAARGDLVLVAPTDAPLLRTQLYDGLLSILDGHEAAVPRHEAMDPVRAVYRRDAAASALLRSEIVSPSALVDRLDAVFLEGTALRAVDPLLASFVDVNRREDLAEAARLAPHPV
jgi:molybdenum cofactor guanylyltransferase